MFDGGAVRRRLVTAAARWLVPGDQVLRTRLRLFAVWGTFAADKGAVRAAAAAVRKLEH